MNPEIELDTLQARAELSFEELDQIIHGIPHYYSERSVRDEIAKRVNEAATKKTITVVRRHDEWRELAANDELAVLKKKQNELQ